MWPWCWPTARPWWGTALGLRLRPRSVEGKAACVGGGALVLRGARACVPPLTSLSLAPATKRLQLHRRRTARNGMLPTKASTVPSPHEAPVADNKEKDSGVRAIVYFTQSTRVPADKSSVKRAETEESSFRVISQTESRRSHRAHWSLRHACLEASLSLGLSSPGPAPSWPSRRSHHLLRVWLRAAVQCRHRGVREPARHAKVQPY